jgi:hypothetical protein
MLRGDGQSILLVHFSSMTDTDYHNDKIIIAFLGLMLKNRAENSV